MLRFEQPDMLWLLVLVVAFILFRFHLRRRSPGAFRWDLFALQSASLVFLVLAVARPQWGNEELQRTARKGNLFLAIDISRSMLAEDVAPNRLAFVSLFAQKLIERVEGISISVFPFARDGYIQVPLTTDVQSVTDTLSTLSANMTSQQGTDLDQVLNTLYSSITKLRQKADESGTQWAPVSVVLLGDGESHTKITSSTLSLFSKESISIHTVGVGTTEGAPILVDGRLFSTKETLRDAKGTPVRTRLEQKTLQEISSATSGVYFPAQWTQLPFLARHLVKSMQFGKARTTFKVRNEFYPWCLIGAFVSLVLFLVLGRWQFAVRLATVLLALFWSVIDSGTAWGLSEEWESKLPRDPKKKVAAAYNEALDQLKQSRTEKAIELFQWVAATDQDLVLKKKALFNLGNLFLKMQDPGQALTAYQQSYDIKTENTPFDKQANQRTSENIVLAAKMEEQQMKQRGQGDDDGDDRKQAKDPGGPQKDFDPEFFEEAERKRLYDLMSAGEQQTLSRIQEQKNKKNPRPWKGNEW